jgi:hypothetical protein
MIKASTIEEQAIRDSLRRVVAAYTGQRRGREEGSGKPLSMDGFARATCEHYDVIKALEARLKAVSK